MRVTPILIFALCGLFGSVIISCSNKETPPPELSIPTSYEGATFQQYSVQERALLENLSNLSAVMRTGNTGAPINSRDLVLAYGTNNPTVKNATSTYMQEFLEGTDGYFNKLSRASAQTYVPGPPVSGTGGVLGSYLFDEQGIEPAELIEKALFGATLYNYGLNLYIQNPNINNPATVDRLLAIFGANPAFPSSDNPTLHSQPDRAAAAVAAQTDRNDGTGPYDQIKTQFIRLQAAYKAGAAYQPQRDQAFSEILTAWEKLHAAAAIQACQRTITLINTPQPTVSVQAEALHMQSRSIGWMLGLRTIPNKVLSEARLDEVLTLLRFPPQGSPTVYEILSDKTAETARLNQAIQVLRTVYLFSDQDLEDLKKNWVNEQRR